MTLIDRLAEVDSRITYLHGLIDMARERKRAYEGANLESYTDWIDESIASMEIGIDELEREYTRLIVEGYG